MQDHLESGGVGNRGDALAGGEPTDPVDIRLEYIGNAVTGGVKERTKPAVAPNRGLYQTASATQRV